MSDQQQILPCVMCNKIIDQMLMLACVHDPCIKCAAKHFCQMQMQAGSNDQARNMYTCSKCGQLTELDSSSVLQLRRQYNNQKRKYDYRKGNGGISTGSNRNLSSSSKKSNQQFSTPFQKQDPDRFQPQKQSIHQNQRQRERSYQGYSNPVSKSSSTYVPQYPISQPSSLHNNAKKGLPYICPDHSDQQISYYCFTCQKPICPQCAIHGHHRQHQVQTTRKAIKSIKQKMLSWNEKISQEFNHQNLKRDQWKKIQKHLSQNIKKERTAVQQHFNKLRNLINDKERQFQKVIDANYQQNMNQIKNHKTNIERNIQKMTNQKKAVDQLNKKDDISVLQQYASRQEEIDCMIQEMNSKNSQEDNKRKEADFKLMQDQIEQVVGILQAMRLSTSLKNKI